jgi:hypothetical protein
MKNKGLYIILFSLMSLISACDLFTENEFEKLYPNEYNSSDEMTGKWILAISPSFWDGFEITEINDSLASDKTYFIGLEMTNGKIESGSNCVIYRLDSTKIYEGRIIEVKNEGEATDPFSYSFMTNSNKTIESKLLHYRIVGDVCQYNRNGEKETCFELDSIYSSIGSVAAIYNSVKNYSQSALDLYNTGVQTNYFDSLKTHMGLLGRAKNSQYLNGVIEIINSIGSQQRSTYSSQENGSNNSPSSSSKKFNIVVEYTPSNNNEYPEGVTVANCQWCSKTFGYVGDFAAMSFDFAKYRHLNLGGFRITENRYGCRVESGTTYCSKRCASKACDADFR